MNPRSSGGDAGQLATMGACGASRTGTLTLLSDVAEPLDTELEVRLDILHSALMSWSAMPTYQLLACTCSMRLIDSKPTRLFWSHIYCQAAVCVAGNHS